MIDDGWSAQSPRHDRRQLAEINVTSLVDVTLVLLIIFMLTAPFIQGGVDVELPDVPTDIRATIEGPVISVDSNRVVHLDDDVVPLSQLSDALRDAMPMESQPPVYLRSDETVPYGFVVQVMAAVQAADIDGLSLVVEDQGRSQP